MDIKTIDKSIANAKESFRIYEERMLSRRAALVAELSKNPPTEQLELDFPEEPTFFNH